MAKGLKNRISRILSSFQTCRSKDTTTLPSNPAPSFPKLINFQFSPAGPSYSKPMHSSLGRHVSSALISAGCGFGSTATLSDDDFRWEQEDKWHVVAKVYDETPRRKIYNSSVSVSAGSDTDDGDLLPLPPPSRFSKKKRRVKKKKTTRRTVRISTSSADSCGLFSSDGYDERDVEEETETLVSPSRSFSTESSSEFNPHLETICETRNTKDEKMKQKQKRMKNKKKKPRRSISMRKKSISLPENGSPARLSMFQRLIQCRVEGKMRESFAVVKKSENPYEDFRSSMIEMILEKQMFEEKDLEQLLRCFLSLNSSRHHGTIIEAFTEIWETLLCTRPTKLS